MIELRALEQTTISQSGCVLKKDYVPPKYEQPVDDINWTAGVGKPAGIYWLEGRSIIAGHGTVAEEHLLGLGAILIATLRFDPDPLERSHAGRVVDRIDPRMFVGPTGPARVRAR